MAINHVGAGSHQAIFLHPDPDIGSLVVHTGIDNIGWGYSLNTASYPTYGGEVVQILSCFVDNLEVGGQIQTYEDMEIIYSYFLKYMQLATQGVKRKKYIQVPITFMYPHRGWQMRIIPTNAPAFKKGRDVVVPEWRIEAFIVDDNENTQELSNLIIEEARIKEAILYKNNKEPFNENFGLQGKIRFTDANPFSDPLPLGTPPGTFSPIHDTITAIADNYNKLIPAYLAGDFSSLIGNVGSTPAATGGPGTTNDASSALQTQAGKAGKAGKAGTPGSDRTQPTLKVGF
jgi:hypothetical protein